MIRKQQRQRGTGSIELIEQAVHLLRLAPAGVLFSYGVGAVPFVLGLLYFWSDMSRGAFGQEHCADAALGMTLLFLWMKGWQSVFASQLLAQLQGRAAPGWGGRRLLRMLMIQAVWQPTALFVLPLGLMIMLPYGWLCAFYHNLSVVGNGEEGGVRIAFGNALRQARLWPHQNHLLIGIAYLFGFFVWLNLYLTVALLPWLIQMLFGIESVFTRSGTCYIFNSTFFAVVACLTYLAINPLMKALYTLRCFYGESLCSGADLQAQLRSFLSTAKAVALLLLLLVIPPATEAAPATPAPEPPPVSTPALDRAIVETINKPEYSWRMPRERLEENRGPIVAFLDSVMHSIGQGLKWTGRMIRKIIDWVQDLMPESKQHQGQGSGIGGSSWLTSVQNLLLILILVTACALGLLFLRVWRQRQRADQALAAEALPPAINLADENVTADQLPADEWLLRARELMDRGEMRLALRALYLGSLATLAQQELIIIAKFKSNRDYERELRRRAHARPGTLEAFTDNVWVFDHVWYGAYDVTRETMEQFEANIRRIQSHA